MPSRIFYISNRHNEFAIIKTIMQGKINWTIWFLQLPLSLLISKSIYSQPGEKLCAHLLLRELQNYNSLLNNHHQENGGSHQKKKIPHAQGQRRSPSKMVEGAKSRLESNPIITREAQSVQNLVHTRNPHRDWARPAFECLSISCGGTGQQWPAAGAGTLGAADLGVT